MTTYAFGGWTFGLNLQNVLNRAQILARITGYGHLGTDATAQTTLVASLVNEAILEVLATNPVLGISSASISLVDGTQSYAVPAAMQGALIERIEFSDSGEEPDFDLATIPYLSPAGVADLPASWRNGEEERDHPCYWSFNETASYVKFFPCPSAAYTLTAYYRAKETSISAANVASPSAVTIGEMPVIGMSVLCYKLASKLAEGIDDALSDVLGGKYEVEMVRFREQVNKTLALDRTDNQGTPSVGPVAVGGLYSGLDPDF